MEIIKITKDNIEKYYNQSNGNIWCREPGSDDFQILYCVDVDATIEDCLRAMENNVEFIFVAVNWRS